MACLIAILALFMPRVIIVLMVLFSDYIGRACGGDILWPLLGFLFMPLTLLAYAFAMNSNGSVDGMYLVLLVLAILADLGLIGTGGRSGHETMRARK